MRAFGITDTGQIRAQNQDTYDIKLFDADKQGIFVVCDGMGGAAGGEVASAIAVETVVKKITEKIKAKMSDSAVKNIMSEAIKCANEAIYERAKKEPALIGMGTTVVCAVRNEDALIIANVGDSRAYVINKNRLKQISIDHSLVNDMLIAGKITPEEAYTHPQKNIITRVLGVDEDVKIDFFEIKTNDDMFLLLCSDGLTNEVSDPEICYEVVNAISEQEACRGLVEIANKRGGHDNITAVLVAF